MQSQPEFLEDNLKVILGNVQLLAEILEKLIEIVKEHCQSNPDSQIKIEEMINPRIIELLSRDIQD